MSHYNPRLQEYLARAEFAGIPPGMAAGEAVNPVCRDRVRIAVTQSPIGTIAEARFEVTGCAPTIAAAARLCERVRGQTSAQALAIDPEGLAADLGGDAAGKRHAFEVVLEALRRAVRAG